MSIKSRLIAAEAEERYQDRDDLLSIQFDIDGRKGFECLDDGFVRLVKVMGDDTDVVQAARVSYQEGTKTINDDRGLIRYLMRHRHSTPFEMVEFKFHVRVPMDTWRQWIRHRTASVNEYSTRYSLAIDSAQTTEPAGWRLQSDKNKQGSSGSLSEWSPSWIEGFLPDGQDTPAVEPSVYLSRRESALQKHAREVYNERICLGIAREQARKDLPLSTYTEAYWKIDLHNLLHFLALRMDSHAQAEIQEYARAIRQIIQPIVPLTWEAFEDYRLHGMTLSHMEIEAIREMATSLIEESSYAPVCRLRGNELREFEPKLTRLGLPTSFNTDSAVQSAQAC